jgi:uracil-DNA glycosylase
MDNALKRDVERYLTQMNNRDQSLMISPADGVEVITPISAADSAFQRIASTDPNSQGSEETSPEQKLAEPLKSNEDAGDRGAPEPEIQTDDKSSLADPFPTFAELDEFNKAIQGCLKCSLGESRNKFVFGVGDPKADLVLIGEAPGAEEDKLGEPFVGRAGKLLDQILAAVDLKRGDGVYICNILKCRPPKNRDPQPAEVHDCEPHLLKQLQLLQPKLIVALGRIAAQTLLRTKESLTKLREQDLEYHGIPLIVTYHPAALLRNPNWKRPTWEDVQKMKRMLDESRGL